jgi:hypothetical protein
VISGGLTGHRLVLEGSHPLYVYIAGEQKSKNKEIKESIVDKIDCQSSYGIRSLLGYVGVVDTVSSCPFPFEHIPQQCTPGVHEECHMIFPYHDRITLPGEDKL